MLIHFFPCSDQCYPCSSVVRFCLFPRCPDVPMFLMSRSPDLAPPAPLPVHPISSRFIPDWRGFQRFSFACLRALCGQRFCFSDYMRCRRLRATPAMATPSPLAFHAIPPHSHPTLPHFHARLVDCFTPRHPTATPRMILDGL